MNLQLFKTVGLTVPADMEFIDAVTRECARRYAALVESVVAGFIGDSDPYAFVREHAAHFREHIYRPMVREFWMDCKHVGTFSSEIDGLVIRHLYRGYKDASLTNWTEISG